MRKHRVLAGFLAALMLLGTMPAALAASVTTSDGIQLDKTAKNLNSNWETEINLTVTAPGSATDEPVAVEFVLDGTYSLFKNMTVSKDNPDKLMIQGWAEAIQEKLKDKGVYVGVTVFGSEAYADEKGKTLCPISKLTSNSTFATDAASTKAMAWLLQHTGTNVQAGIQSGMAELNSLGTAVAPSNRYLVLITDGGSFWRMDGNKAVNDTTSTGTLLQNNDAAELDINGKTLKSGGSFDALIRAGVNTEFHQYTAATLAGVLQEIQTTGAYTNFEKGVYAAKTELDKIKKPVNGDSAKLITVGYQYYADTAGLEQLTSLADGLIDYAVALSDRSWKLANAEATSALDPDGTSMIDKIVGGIAAQIGVSGSSEVVVGRGSTITDVIGTGTDNLKADYDFELVTDKTIQLSINGSTYTGAKNDNTWTFDDGSELVYTSGSSEQFVLTLGQALLPGQKLVLTYTAKLTNPSEIDGSHKVYPNVQAYLTPNGSNDQLAFPRPALNYSVGGSDSGDGYLNTKDHFSYIIGYKDGYLRPNGNITRGEVATIFFRLLTDDARERYWAQTNKYSDVAPEKWCNNAISTLSNLGIIDGYLDGTFRPDGKITRAEFAKMAVNFFDYNVEEYQGYFPDVDENSWYAGYVEAAKEMKLIEGYIDGSFQPNKLITRAEACTIVNRTLGRVPDKDHMLPNSEMETWPDCRRSDWFYEAMMEATNSHDYTWITVNGEKIENWTEKLPQRDWAALEKTWSTAHSAPGGQVVG